MAFSLSEAFSGAALVLAVCSPFITAAINSYTQKREREAAFFDKRRAEVYDCYMKYASVYILNPTTESHCLYLEYLGMLLLLVDNDVADMVMELDREFRAYSFKEKGASAALMDKLAIICNQLSGSYPRLKNKRRNKHT